MKKVLGVVGILLLLGACGTENGPTGAGALVTESIEIDWVDFLMIQDEQYESYDTAVLSGVEWVGEEMGQVEFKVAENVSDPGYRTKNGDAAFWKVGTTIYEVKGMPGMAAVPDQTEVNGYRVYATREALEDLEVHYQDVDFKGIGKVEFFEGYGTPKLVSSLADTGEIAHFLELLDAGEIDSMYMPSEEDGDPIFYRMVLYKGGAIAHKFNMFWDGRNWYWHPWDTEILPAEIGKLIVED